MVSFTSITLFSGKYVKAKGVCLFDFNNDNYLDILVGDTILYGPFDKSTVDHQISIQTSYTTGPFDYIYDLNKDGKIDKILPYTDLVYGKINITYGVSSNTAILSSVPNTILSSAPITSTPFLGFGDFNSDGLTDIAAVGYPNKTLLIFTQNINRTFSSSSVKLINTDISAYGLNVADFNRDGQADILIYGAGYSGGLGVFLGGRTFLFDGFSNINSILNETFQSATTADFNNDGNIDIAAISNKKLYVFLGDGNGHFSPTTTYDTNDAPYSIALADLNNDGNLDIIVGNTYSNTSRQYGNISIYYGNGGGAFSNQTILETPNCAAFGLFTGDLNNDNKQDIIAVDSNSGNICIFLNNPSPAAPIITSASNSTNNSKPTITGTAEINSIVNIYDGSVSLGTVKVSNSSGIWTFIPSTSLNYTEHTIRAVAADPAGNISAYSNAITISINAPPTMPPIITTTLGLTNKSKPMISGLAEANNSILLYDDAAIIGTATVGVDKSFSIYPSIDLSEGIHSLVVISKDSIGNLSSQSNTLSITIDTKAPTPPIIFSTSYGANKVLIPIITGNAEPNSTITLYDGDKNIGTLIASTSGNFTVTPNSLLLDGLHNLYLTATDGAGNISAASNIMKFNINTQPATTGQYQALSKSYTIIFNSGSIQIINHSDINFTDNYSTIKSIKFLDLNFDVSLLIKMASLQSSQIVSLVQLYVASFNRAPDSVGLYYWGSRLYDGMSLQDIAQSFFDQPETISAYPSTMLTGDFVTKVYNNVLSRAPDTAGLNYWVGELGNGHISKNSFLLAIINGAMASTGSAIDRQTLANKEAVGEHYAIFDGLNNSTTWSKDVMSGVTNLASSVTAANTKADAYAITAANPMTSDLIVKLLGIAV